MEDDPYAPVTWMEAYDAVNGIEVWIPRNFDEVDEVKYYLEQIRKYLKQDHSRIYDEA